MGKDKFYALLRTDLTLLLRERDVTEMLALIKYPAQSVITSHSLSIDLETKEQKIIARPAAGGILVASRVYNVRRIRY